MRKIGLTVFFITAVSAFLYASYEDAVALFQKNRYEESLKICADELVVEDDMKAGAPNYNIRFLAAHIHWKLGNTKSVIAHFRRCMDIRSESVAPYIDLSLYLTDLGRYGDAEETARDGLKVREDAMLYYALGKSYLVRENFWKAKRLFEKANGLDPELYASYNALGIALMKLKKYREANTAFQVALVMRRTSPELLNNVGKSLERMGKRRKAFEYYKKAHSLDDENGVILQNLNGLKDYMEN